MKAQYYAPLLAIAVFAVLSGCNTATGNDSSSATSASTSSSSASGSYTLSDGSTVSTSGVAYASTTSDVSAIYVTSGTLTLADPTITKSGDVSSTESCKKGLNAAVLASSSSAKIAITGGSIVSSAKGGNAAFAYNGATFSLSGTTITCSGSAEARALYATYGGSITATSVTASTTGNNSSVVATDQGGGTIALTGGSFTASGTDSAGLYSTGTITGHGITATSSSGEACVIEGSNSITLDTASVLSSGCSKRGILILQSGSGDATGYDAKFTMTGGSITTTKTASDATSSKDAYQTAPLFEVTTNTTGTITLTDVALSAASGVLMEVDYDTGWSTSGATGAMVLASASTYSVTGDVYVDSYSNASMTVGSGVTWTGAFAKSSPKTATVTVSSGGVWKLSADSYVTSLVNNGTVNKNGHTLYVNGVAQS
jgi:hypothetical protein